MHKKVEPAETNESESPYEIFLDDLIVLSKYSLKEQIAFTDKAFEWFPERLDSNWRELTKESGSTRKKETIRAFKALYFLICQGIEVEIAHKKIITDIRASRLSEEFISHFLRRLEERKKDIIKKAERTIDLQPESKNIDKIKVADGRIDVYSGQETYTALSLIVASGSSPKRLGIPGEKEYTGKGVSYCATCDGPLFKDKDVVVVGGGNEPSCT